MPQCFNWRGFRGSEASQFGPYFNAYAPRWDGPLASSGTNAPATRNAARPYPLESSTYPVWFVVQEPKPVDEPKIRLREFVVDPKTRKLKVIIFENGKKVTSADLPVQQAVEQFFDDVLKNCFGVVV